MSDRRALRAGTSPVSGTVHVPGSKSIANRALVIAALADGDSQLVGVPDGDDTMAMLSCLDRLGITTETAGTTVVVGGRGGALHPSGPLDTKLAGTTSRFVTAMAALADVPVIVDGDPPLRARPMADLHTALAELGVAIDYGEAHGHLPVTVTGPLVAGGAVGLRGDVSSQFITALMLIAPLLDGGLALTLTTPLVSVPYVQLTASVMAEFGVDGVTVDERRVVVPPGHYRGCRFDIEADASSASYPLAIAAVRGGGVTVAGLARSSGQGDIAILDILAAMGCHVEPGAESVTVRRDATELVGIDVDMADVSDLVPTVAAVAVIATTPTTIRGVGFIRGKESDRLGDLATELAKTGALIDVTHDGLNIEPVRGGPTELHGAELETHHDHRLAMAFAVLAAVVDGIAVSGADSVNKSWPGFWAAYDELLSPTSSRR